MLIGSPVRGLRPCEAARSATVKVPKPTRRTSSPFRNAAATASKTPSTAFVASPFDRPVLVATTPIKSFLFTWRTPLSAEIRNAGISRGMAGSVDRGALARQRKNTPAAAHAAAGGHTSVGNDAALLVAFWSGLVDLNRLDPVDARQRLYQRDA